MEQTLCRKLTSNSQSASLTRTKMPGLLGKQDKLFKSSCAFRCCQRIVCQKLTDTVLSNSPSITGSWRYKRETNAQRARNEHETMSERKPTAISHDHSLRKTVTRKKRKFQNGCPANIVQPIGWYHSSRWAYRIGQSTRPRLLQSTSLCSLACHVNSTYTISSFWSRIRGFSIFSFPFFFERNIKNKQN